MTKKLLGDSKEDLRLMIKEYKELENISTSRRSLDPGSGGHLNYFLVREEDEKKNYKIKLAIKRMYTAVWGSTA